MTSNSVKSRRQPLERKPIAKPVKVTLKLNEEWGQSSVTEAEIRVSMARH
ncbi:MAG: hypothetical protein ABMA26_21595 [Limisphaerales bacterium]